MNAAEMRKKSMEELEQVLKDLLREQFNLRMQKGSGQLGRPSRVRDARREVARVRTIMHEKSRGSAA
ncbi:MAG: 50S ribosomal protein L29 [Gammaproteobacteria bacterium]|nr:50S ribosomal protein L29 [Gammaproteobacteria bacterium]